MPHLLATIVTLRYTPGLASGFLLNVPITIYLLKRGLKEHIYEVKSLIYSTIGIVAFSILFIKLSFIIGGVEEQL